MKILKEKPIIGGVRVQPGDTLSVTYSQYLNTTGEKIFSKELINAPITKRADYDTVLIVEFEDGELGLAGGLGGVVGKKKWRYDL